jgi:hypothetical protein
MGYKAHFDTTEALISYATQPNRTLTLMGWITVTELVVEE